MECDRVGALAYWVYSKEGYHPGCLGSGRLPYGLLQLGCQGGQRQGWQGGWGRASLGNRGQGLDQSVRPYGRVADELGPGPRVA